MLDTDTITALQHNNPGVIARVRQIPPTELFVSIVLCEEQVAGRLHVLRGNLTRVRLAEAYRRLEQTIRFFAAVNILPYDQAASHRDEELRRLYRRL